MQISPHLLLLISLAAFRVRRRKQTKDVKRCSSNSQAPKENFAGLNTLSPGLTAILNWSNSTSRLTIQLILYSVYTLLIVSNYCAFFLETDSACLCLEPINIAASATGKIAATFLCMYLWMQDLIALKMCSTCLKPAVLLSSMNRPGSFFQTMKNRPLSFSNSITWCSFSQKKLVDVLSLLIRSFMSSQIFLCAHDCGI